MPYQPKQKPNTCHPSTKGKKIIKNNKTTKTQQAYDTPEKEYVDQNTLSDTPNSQEQFQRPNYATTLVLMYIKQLHSICRYGQDTLYVCLQLLSRIKIQIEETKAKLYAATILQMAAKVHQFRTPRFSDLVTWGNYVYSREELIGIQGLILLHLEFKIPASLSFQTIKHATEAIKKVQLKLETQNLYNFQ